MLPIWDIYLGSEFFHPGSRVNKITDPKSQIRIRIEEFKYCIFTQTTALGSRKNNLGCLSRIPNPGVKKALDSRSQIRIRNTGNEFKNAKIKLFTKATKISSRKFCATLWNTARNLTFRNVGRRCVRHLCRKFSDPTSSAGPTNSIFRKLTTTRT